MRLKKTLVLLAFLAVGCVQPKSRSDLEEVPISVPLVADVVPHESLHYGNVAIPSAKSQAELYFYVGGAVRAPGRYEWQDGMNLEAIQAAGGFTASVRTIQIHHIHGPNRASQN